MIVRASWLPETNKITALQWCVKMPTIWTPFWTASHG